MSTSPLSDFPVLALDLGGTKLAGAVIDVVGHIAYRQLVPSAAQEGGERILQRVTQLATTLRARARSDGIEVRAVGLGTGGIVAPDSGVILFANELLPSWTGMPVKSRLEAALGLPAAIINDVQAMALGEAQYGAGLGANHLLCLTVGTGIGGGVIWNGELYLGSRGGAGGVGHIKVIANGKHCNCGGEGCLEMYASGNAIEESYRQRLKSEASISVREIAKRALEGDPIAGAAIQEAGFFLGVGITSLVHVLDPERVVIGGGVAQIGDLLFDPVRRAVREQAFPPMRETPILPAALGPDAGLVGAATAARKLTSR